MASTSTAPAAVASFAQLVASFHRALRAERKSPATVRSYAKATNKLLAFLTANGMPTDIEGIRREHIESFIESLEGSLAPATIAQVFRSLHVFFGWLHAEDMIQANPMARMRHPHVPLRPVPVIPDEDIRRMLAQCDGRSLTDRRDAAIILMFWTSGMRLAELAGLRVDDLDLDRRKAYVRGKGERYRWAKYGHEAAKALDRYLVMRARHPVGQGDDLWIGERGPLTAWGIAQAVKRRGARAGVTIHPHQLRHTFISAWLASGGQENTLVEAVGWADNSAPILLRRYARATAAQRAEDQHDIHAPRLGNRPR